MPISAIVSADEKEWMILWEAYLAFYHTVLPKEQFKSTFERLTSKDGNIHGLMLRNDQGESQGIAHYLFHSSCWTEKTHCYLNDLYVNPECRGKGYGKALIKAVEQKAREQGSARLYWSTAPDNITARKLYDTVATTDRVQYRMNL